MTRKDLVQAAKKQIREFGSVDCVMYIDLTNAGINPEALIERVQEEK